jgi:hypothetical protein
MHIGELRHPGIVKTLALLAGRTSVLRRRKDTDNMTNRRHLLFRDYLGRMTLKADEGKP